VNGVGAIVLDLRARYLALLRNSALVLGMS